MDVAKQLLTDASQFSNEEDVKGEIERRLKMLDPKPLRLRICASCRKTFQAGPKKLFRQKFCEDCVKKKLGSQC